MSEHGVQPFAEAYAGRRRMMDSRGHQFRTTKLQKSPVTDAMVCRPFEDANRVGVGYPPPKDLAGLVPVDQKDKRCAECFEKDVAVFIASGRTAAGDKVEDAALAEAGCAFAFKATPLNREIANELGRRTSVRRSCRCGTRAPSRCFPRSS